MARRDNLTLPRSLFERFRPAPAGTGASGAPNLISTLQAYGGLQAWAARAHRPAQSLGRIGALEVRLAQTAAEVRQAHLERADTAEALRRPVRARGPGLQAAIGL